MMFKTYHVVNTDVKRIYINTLLNSTILINYICKYLT